MSKLNKKRDKKRKKPRDYSREDFLAMGKSKKDINRFYKFLNQVDEICSEAQEKLYPTHRGKPYATNDIRNNGYQTTRRQVKSFFTQVFIEYNIYSPNGFNKLNFSTNANAGTNKIEPIKEVLENMIDSGKVNPGSEDNKYYTAKYLQNFAHALRNFSIFAQNSKVWKDHEQICSKAYKQELLEFYKEKEVIDKYEERNRLKVTPEQVHKMIDYLENEYYKKDADGNYKDRNAADKIALVKAQFSMMSRVSSTASITTENLNYKDDELFSVTSSCKNSLWQEKPLYNGYKEDLQKHVEGKSGGDRIFDFTRKYGSKMNTREITHDLNEDLKKASIKLGFSSGRAHFTSHCLRRGGAHQQMLELKRYMNDKDVLKKILFSENKYRHDLEGNQKLSDEEFKKRYKRELYRINKHKFDENGKLKEGAKLRDFTSFELMEYIISMRISHSRLFIVRHCYLDRKHEDFADIPGNNY